MNVRGANAHAAPTLWRRGVVLLIVVWAAVYFIRMSGPPDILDSDQLRPAAYANDVLVNGRWFVQTDVRGDIASKPPLSTWVIALFSLPAGRATIWTLTIPSALAMLGSAGLAMWFARRWLGVGAGLVAGLAILLSPMGAKQTTQVRTDALYAFMAALTTVLVWRAVRRGRGWLFVWLACAGVIMTKGPPAVVIALAGLLALWWERRTPGEGEGVSVAIRAKGSRTAVVEHVVGGACFLLIVGGWMLLAWRQAGQPFIDKVIGNELIRHGVPDSFDWRYLRRLVNPALYYLVRFAPASLFTYAALWRIWRRPSQDAALRFLERFLFCSFVVGLLMFTLAPHKRADLLTPLWFVGAALAAGEMVRLAAAWRPSRRFAALTAWIVIALASMFFYYAVLTRDSDPRVRAAGLQRLAQRIERINTAGAPLLHVDDNSALQFYLGTMQLRVAPEDAADALASDRPALVAASMPTSKLDPFLDRADVMAQIVASWDDEHGWGVRVLANPQALDAIELNASKQ